MIGMRGRFKWLRNRGYSHGGIHGSSRVSYERPVALAIGACCVLLALLGTLQFVWIGRVSDSQRTAEGASLRRATRLAIIQVQKELELMLATFKADADFERSRRLETYRQRQISWHEVSLHGPMVKRIFFYDMPAPGSGDLTELVTESERIRPAKWGRDLALVRQHIHELAFAPGRPVAMRWLVTWMFHPQAMAIYRPIVKFDSRSRNAFYRGRVTGYLILQLDRDFIRDRLIPDMLNDHFGSWGESARYAVTLKLDGKSLYVYEPSGNGSIVPPEVASEASGYSLSPLQGQDAADWIESPDQSSQAMLTSTAVPNPVSLRGGIQRIGLRGRAERLRLADLELGPLSLTLNANSDDATQGQEPASVLRQSLGLPRLFLAADTQHRLTVEVRRLGATLDAVVNRNYKRSVAVGMVVLMLLVGATAIVAVFGRSAARLAEVRMEAVASQSHQLRNPLAAISVLADSMVRGRPQSGEKVVEYGGMIRDYAKRLNETVDRAMRVAAMESFETRYNLTMLDVSKVAEDALEEARPLIESAGFAEEHTFAEGLPMVRANAEALRHSLGDLLSNAVKYGQPGRWVKLETADAAVGRRREVLIRVHDRGRGIAEHEMRKIFEPYYRGAGVASSSIPGSGLGLTLVRGTVRRMGGKLTVDSEEGRGTVFTMHFPVRA